MTSHFTDSLSDSYFTRRFFGVPFLSVFTNTLLLSRFTDGLHGVQFY